MSEKEEKPKKSKLKRFTRIVWVFFVLGAVGLPTYIWSVSANVFNLFGELPSYSQLENPKQNLSSLLYSTDGQILGSYYRDNRNPVTYDELGDNLINALLAAEDIRFENHSGIDLESMGRVAFGVLTFSPKGGGSTISQQLAKQLFSTRVIREEEKGSLEGINGKLDQLIYKTKEWILAVRLERSYTKKEIMAMYYNTVEFSNNAHGIMSASKTYFNKPPNELSVPEAAVLAGMQKQVDGFRPDKYPERSKWRRNVVMSQMVKYGFLDQTAFDTLRAKDIVLDFKAQDHLSGQAQYLREEVKKDLLQIGKEYGFDLYADGVRVYTTIDSRMQRHAERAVDSTMRQVQRNFLNSLKEDDSTTRDPWIDKNGRVIRDFIENGLPRSGRYRSLVKAHGKGSDSVDFYMNKAIPMKIFSWKGDIDTLLSPLDSIKYYKRFLHSGFMAADPHTGQIKAWVGGINFNHFKFDHVRHGKRQPGSLFKPFVYAKAVEVGWSPCDKFEDVATTVNINGYEAWTPKNSDNTGYTGKTMHLKTALARSVNSISAQVIQRVKPDNAVNMVKRLGIQSRIQPFPSMVLGTQDVSLHEVVGAYGTFANKGTYIEPHFITRIEDRFGNVIYSKVPQKKSAISEQTAYTMLNMLQETVNVGSGIRLKSEYKLIKWQNDSNQIGAKTGTTQNASDGWFMAVTKDLVAGAWVGGDDRAIHFDNWVQGQGARTALPIVGRFLEKVYKDTLLSITKGPFQVPEKLDFRLDCAPLRQIPIQQDSAARDSVIFDEDIYRPD